MLLVCMHTVYCAIYHFTMHILIVNDDGIDSAGVAVLAKTILEQHPDWTLRVCCPCHERCVVIYVYCITVRSGSSHLITFDELRAEVRIFNEPILAAVPAIAITGTPADCTVMGVMNDAYIHCQYPPTCKVDIVLSGINHGGM